MKIKKLKDNRPLPIVNILYGIGVKPASKIINKPYFEKYSFN